MVESWADSQFESFDSSLDNSKKVSRKSKTSNEVINSMYLMAFPNFLK